MEGQKETKTEGGKHRQSRPRQGDCGVEVFTNIINRGEKGYNHELLNQEGIVSNKSLSKKKE